MPETATTTRSTIALPVERIAQLKSLADARKLSVAGLVEHWIGEAVARGDEGAIGLPGFSAMLDDNLMFVEIAGHALPWLKPDRARLLAAILSGAAGRTDPQLTFALQIGRGVPVELGDGAKLIVGRHGRGCVFALEVPSRDTVKFAAHPNMVAELPDDIRRELGIH